MTHLIEYLAEKFPEIAKHGSGGPNPSKVWIIEENGELYHTYAEPNPKQKSVGGAEIPIMMFENGELFAPQIKEKVIPFLQSFGLEEKDANEVVKKIQNKQR
jgi:hypothetical protein